MTILLPILKKEQCLVTIVQLVRRYVKVQHIIAFKAVFSIYLFSTIENTGLG